ncbi:hypothetical protein F4780DRAFT_750172 [Xylariomycetidae sp. FL0641]|nr:hypothetical protein F4780DRAFT_750172 [Xylariomycetidae sp. FL0641]
MKTRSRWSSRLPHRQRYPGKLQVPPSSQPSSTLLLAGWAPAELRQCAVRPRPDHPAVPVGEGDVPYIHQGSSKEASCRWDQVHHIDAGQQRQGPASRTSTCDSSLGAWRRRPGCQMRKKAIGICRKPGVPAPKGRLLSPTEDYGASDSIRTPPSFTPFSLFKLHGRTVH